MFAEYFGGWRQFGPALNTPLDRYTDRRFHRRRVASPTGAQLYSNHH